MLNSNLNSYSRTPLELCNFIHGKKTKKTTLTLSCLIKKSLFSPLLPTKSQVFSSRFLNIPVLSQPPASPIYFGVGIHVLWQYWKPHANVGTVRRCKWLPASGDSNLQLFRCRFSSALAPRSFDNNNKKKDEYYGNDLLFYCYILYLFIKWVFRHL